MRSGVRLGPIVGHTDRRSTRIWIRVHDDPAFYELRVPGRGLFPFASTEVGGLEFHTAIAVADGLRSDRRYRYQVLRQGRVVGGAGGSFRTMPDPGSFAEMSFLAISCNHHGEAGAWEELAAFVERAQPRFLVMMGDNVYVDKDPNVWKEHLGSGRAKRREAIADQYQKNWSREPVRRVLANIPTYMIWDDHDIRDGWGSFAPDSPTLAALYSRGKKIFDKYNAYFEDARDVYWHFQMCHNPPPGENVLLPPAADDPHLVGVTPGPGERGAMPFVFRCGRVAVVVLDSRGDRDLWRAHYPVLGAAQWEFIGEVFRGLDPSLDAVVVVTPVPIVGMDPDGQSQFLLGRRIDDVSLFKEGDEAGLAELQDQKGSVLEIPLNAISGWAKSRFGVSLGWGGYKLSDIDDVRDQWANHFSRPEQIELIRRAVEATLSNRLLPYPRGLLFLGGDWHSGGLFDIEVARPACRATCLISSGISQKNDPSIEEPHIGTLVDEEFDVAPGIRATMRDIVNGYNFGVVQVVPTGLTPTLVPAVAHEGNSFAWGIQISLSTPGVL